MMSRAERRSTAGKWKLSSFRAGDWVEVRSEEEILSTLDDAGRLGGMPFMPEMLSFCGRRMRVEAVAHKTCETARQSWTGRRLSKTVHLEGTRCDGSAHAGCDAACNLFWRDEWLRRVPAPPASRETSHAKNATDAREGGSAGGCTRSRLSEATRRPPGPGRDEVRYSCQATELFEASRPLSWWDPRQYARDILSGNQTLGHALKVLAVAVVRAIRKNAPRGYRIWTWLHERVHDELMGRPVPRVEGRIPRGDPTPARALNLRPGQWVRIRELEDILATLDEAGKNRGLRFDYEMVPFCGSSVRVKGYARRIIDEGTGAMIDMKTPCVLLEGVICRSEYSECRLLCPRRIHSFWREIWLEPLGSDDLESTSVA